jgi:hypothetical protein
LVSLLGGELVSPYGAKPVALLSDYVLWLLMVANDVV